MVLHMYFYEQPLQYITQYLYIHRFVHQAAFVALPVFITVLNDPVTALIWYDRIKKIRFIMIADMLHGIFIMRVNLMQKIIQEVLKTCKY